MKKDFSRILSIFSILFLSIGLFNCNIADSEEPIGSINLTIAEEVSRTLLPELSMEVHSYKITGSGPNAKTFTNDATDPILTVDNLEIGEWALAVKAVNKDGVEIGSGTKNVTVKSNEISNLTVVVTPLSGNGSLELTLDWTKSDVSKPKVLASLEPVNSDEITLAFVIDGTKATYKTSELLNGYYKLVLQLFDDEKLVYGTKEIVRIVYNQSTSGVFTFESNIPEVPGWIVANIDLQLANPLTVLVEGGAEVKKHNATVALSASVKDYTDSVIYDWSVNGITKGTDSIFNFDDSWELGQYNISVSVFSSDGLRAGSETFIIKVVNENYNSSHCLSFNSNGGIGTMVPQILEEGSTINLSTNSYSKDGLIFSEWNTSVDGTGSPYADNATFIMGKSDVILYAQWNPIEEFITKWDVLENTLRIPLSKTGTYDFSIDWGDGQKEHIIGTNGKEYIEHTYNKNREYIVTIYGICNGFGYRRYSMEGNIPANGYLKDVLNWGSVKLRDGGSQFYYCESLMNISATDTLDTSNITDMGSMFYYANNFTGDISKWDTSNVTNMSYMFYEARNFTGDISTWNTSKVTDMRSMFVFNKKFNSDLSMWDTSNVTNMSGMFAYAKTYNDNISAWDTSEVTDMSGMFRSASSFNGNISKWDTSNVTDMNRMFEDAISFRGDISEWDTSNVTNMKHMFYKSTIDFNGSFNGDLSKWNTSNVVNMEKMFYCSERFNCGGIDLSTWEWDVSKVETMADIFDFTRIEANQISWLKEESN